MKNNKKHIAEGLLEGLAELVLTLIFFGIGAYIVSLFGVDFNSPDVDHDLIVLLGIVAFFVIFVIAYALIRWVKKIIRGKFKD
jgi:hypothetical protein